MLTWPYKDPDEVLDYEINWTARLASDVINSSIWIITPTGGAGDLVEESSSFVDAATFIWLSEGVLGTKYTLTNRVTTTGGRTMDQSVVLKIKTK